jgi:hypothetical protein
MWHLLTLGAMGTCGWLAAWQWQRAGSAMGSALNVGYGLQWPVFAVFFGVMWWRMLRMEAAELDHGAHETSADEATTDGVSGAGAVVEEPPVDEAAADAGVPAAGAEVAGPVPEPRTAEPRAATADAAPSPFGPRPRGVAPPPADDDPELAAYNQMLAQLAARHSDD